MTVQSALSHRYLHKKKLKELIEAEPAYQEMDEDAYDMAAAYANAEELIAVKKYHGKDGKVNMCKAIQEMLEDERQEGRQEGREEGIQVGVQRERQVGMQALIETCQELGMTKEQAADKVVAEIQNI